MPSARFALFFFCNLHTSDSRDEILEILLERRAEVFAAQCEFHRRLEEAELVAEVVALALKIISVDGLLARQFLQCIRELDLAALAGCRMLQDAKDSGRMM